MLCIAYCNSTFSDLNVAGSHYFPFPLLFIAVTLAIMFIAALLLYFVKRMQWYCSGTVAISYGLDDYVSIPGRDQDFLISTISVLTLRPIQHLIC